MKKQERLRGGWTKYPQVQRLLVIAVLALVMMVVAGCGGDAGEEGAVPVEQGLENIPTGQPTLTCSQECADRGQCGESTDRGTVVLLSTAQPAVTAADHNLAVPEGTTVSIVETRPITVVENASGLEFPVNFHRVSIPLRNVEGWVADWCIVYAQ